MIPLETLIAFFGTALLLAIVPGPDNLFVLLQAATRGWLAGLAVTFGLCTGLVFHTLAVTFGVAAIFQASALAFTILKYVGAAYLLWLAWKAYQASASQFNAKSEENMSILPLYRRGIVMNITNPKVSIFFLAFLPQFADPSKGSMAQQMILLGLVFIFAALLVFGLISVLAGAIGGQISKNPSIQLFLNRIASLVFAGLAVRLALSER